MGIATTNPATGERVRSFDELRDEEVDQRLARAGRAFGHWRRVPVSERCRIVAHLADVLLADRDSLAALATLEMGKTLKSAREEVEKCARCCSFYAEHAPRMLEPTRIAHDGEDGHVRYLPLGPVLAVMPWNFPYWQVIRFAAPALCAGNVALLKHASNVPQVALALEELVRRAGAPEGVFETLLVGSEKVARIIADERVRAVTLTGSEAAGRQVAAEAGKALKKCVLELGGSDPFIVCASADLERAAKVAVQARCINNGQSCIASKRFIVLESVADEFVRRFVEGMRALKVGDPMREETDLGPLAMAKTRDDLERQVNESVKQGARVLCGGKRLEGPGNYFAPTVLTDIPPDAPAATEEVFGPVATVWRVKTVDEALRLANASRYGLSSSVWTNDAAEADWFANELEAGSVFVNAMTVSDPRFPFGGVKASGYGRELSENGLREFVNVKTVRMFRPQAKGSKAE